MSSRSFTDVFTNPSSIMVQASGDASNLLRAARFLGGLFGREGPGDLPIGWALENMALDSQGRIG